MSPRPRTVSDEAILRAAGRVIGRVGPDRLTLAEVAGEVGLAPATLIQRFGSKRGLLLAFAKAAAATAAEPFADALAGDRSPIEALWRALLSMAEHVRTAESMANNLAFLQVDLSDPEFHRYARAHAHSVRAGIVSLLERAIAAGELLPCDADRLGSALHTTFNGALLSWAILGDGSVDEWVRRELSTVLSPWLVAASL